MAYVLLLIGFALLIAGVRNTQDNLYALVKGDFTGPHNFWIWFVAIFLIGSLGNIKAIKPLSDAFLVLVIVVLFIANRGFFAQASAALGQTQTTQLSMQGGYAGVPLTSTSLSNPDLVNLPGLFGGTS